MRFLDMPPSNSGEMLLQNSPQLAEYRVVLEEAEDGSYEYRGFYDPDVTYENEKNLVAVPFTSTYVSHRHLGADTEFANIIGSSGDPVIKDGKEYPTKIDLFKDVFYPSMSAADWAVEKRKCYVEEGKIHTASGDAFLDGNTCSVGSSACAGHITLGTQNENFGPAITIGLIPICSKHNLKKIPKPPAETKTGAYYYMKTRGQTPYIEMRLP